MSNILEFIYSEIPKSKGRIDDKLSISANEIGTLIARYCESQKSAIPIVGDCFLEKSSDDFIECDVTSCCNIGPITRENYCPNCGKKIKRE